MKVYFDNAATTVMRPKVIESMVEVMKNTFANASATYALGRSAKAILETSRKNIAKQFGVHESEIVFTSGGTEANNMILQSAVEDLGIQQIISSKIEHHAVLKTCEYLESLKKVSISYVSILKDGTIDYKHLETLLSSAHSTTLVSLMHINNETGVILDIERVGNLCDSYGVLFHSDTVQTIGHFKVNFKKVKLHFATASAHKFYGPKGVGFAYIDQSCKLKPLLHGGEQERGVRAGTEPIHQVFGMYTALEIAYQQLEKESKQIVLLKDNLVKKLQIEIPGVIFNALSNEASRNYNLLNIQLPISSEKANTILFELDLAGIAISRGSACQSGSNKPSHVLAEILNDNKVNKVSIRISLSIYNTNNEIYYFVETIKKLVLKYNV